MTLFTKSLPNTRNLLLAGTAVLALASCDTYEDENILLTEQLAQTQAQLADANAALTGLEADLLALSGENTTLMANILIEQSLVASLTTQLEDLTAAGLLDAATIASLTQEIADANALISTLEASELHLQGRISVLNQSVRTLVDRSNANAEVAISLSDDLIELRAEYADLLLELEAADLVIAGIRNSLAAVSTANTELTTENADLVQALEDAKVYANLGNIATPNGKYGGWYKTLDYAGYAVQLYTSGGKVKWSSFSRYKAPGTTGAEAVVVRLTQDGTTIQVAIDAIIADIQRLADIHSTAVTVVDDTITSFDVDGRSFTHLLTQDFGGETILTYRDASTRPYKIAKIFLSPQGEITGYGKFVNAQHLVFRDNLDTAYAAIQQYLVDGL